MTSVTYTGTRSRNLFTFIRGNRRPDGTCCLTVPASRTSSSRSRRAEGVVRRRCIQVEQALCGAARRWGFSLTYTLGKAEQNGGDLFSLDFPRVPTIRAIRPAPTNGHRLVMTGIVGLPWDFIASTFITLGSGTPYTINDQSRAAARTSGVAAQRRPSGTVRVHLSGRLGLSQRGSAGREGFHFAGAHVVSVIFQGFNIFSFDNFSGYQGFIPTLPATNPNFGRPSSLIDPGAGCSLG